MHCHHLIELDHSPYVIEQEPSESDSVVKEPIESHICPVCGSKMRLVETLKAKSREPP